MAITFKGAQIRDLSIETDKLAAAAVTPAKSDLTSTWDFSSGTLRSAAPSGDSDVATKSYVDGVAAGLYWKDPVRVATTGNITLSGTQTIDGVSISADDRVLVKDQSSASENGIYVCAAGAWSRSADMDAGSEFPSAAVFVSEGTVNADTGFVCTNDSAPSLGSDDIAFVQFTGTGSIVAGAGIAKSGSTLSVETTALGGLTFSSAGDSGTLEVAVRSTGGLEVFGGELEVKRAANGGLASDANGLAIDLDTNPGLELGAGGVKVKINAANPGLVLDGAGLSVKAKANGGIVLDADGLSIATANGVQVDGGGFVTLNLDGSSLAKSASGVKVAADGIGVEQQGFRYRSEYFDAVSATFDLANEVDAKNNDGVRAFLNGQRLRKVASSPSDVFEYTVTTAGGTTTVTLGASTESGDLVTVDYVSD